MHRRGERVRLADDDGGRQDIVAAQAGELPQPGEGERLEILALEPVGLLAVGTLLPFEKADSWDQRTPATSRSSAD